MGLENLFLVDVRNFTRGEKAKFCLVPGSATYTIWDRRICNDMFANVALGLAVTIDVAKLASWYGVGNLIYQTFIN